MRTHLCLISKHPLPNLIHPKDYLTTYGLTMKSNGAPPAGYDSQENGVGGLRRPGYCTYRRTD